MLAVWLVSLIHSLTHSSSSSPCLTIHYINTAVVVVAVEAPSLLLLLSPVPIHCSILFIFICPSVIFPPSILFPPSPLPLPLLFPHTPFLKSLPITHVPPSFLRLRLTLPSLPVPLLLLPLLLLLLTTTATATAHFPRSPPPHTLAAHLSSSKPTLLLLLHLLLLLLLIPQSALLVHPPSHSNLTNCSPIFICSSAHTSILPFPTIIFYHCPSQIAYIHSINKVLRSSYIHTHSYIPGHPPLLPKEKKRKKKDQPTTHITPPNTNIFLLSRRGILFKKERKKVSGRIMLLL